ncbi:MAG: glycoside hydrolase family 17 protein, partial [Methylobacter sp.]
MIKKIATLIALALLVIINFSIWSYVNNPLQLQPWTKTTMGLTYDPMRKQDTQTSNTYPSEADMDNDLALLANKVHAIRTYTVLKGEHKIPELATKHNLNVTLGAWIGPDLEKNRQEIETLINISRQDNPKIVRVMVGNEVLLRKDVTEAALIDYIREVKKRNWRPVSTSETWDQWLAHPKLVDEVDFIAVHILPFWEGISAADAVDYVFDRYHQVQQTYPNKPVIITEV